MASKQYQQQESAAKNQHSKKMRYPEVTQPVLERLTICLSLTIYLFLQRLPFEIQKTKYPSR